MTSRSARRIASDKRREERKEFEQRRAKRVKVEGEMTKTIDELGAKYGKPILEMSVDELYVTLGVEIAKAEEGGEGR